MRAPFPSCSSKVGSASAPLTSNCVSEGPKARTTTLAFPPTPPRIKPADHDIAARLDKAAGTDVGKLRIGRSIQVIALDQADPGAATFSVTTAV